MTSADLGASSPAASSGARAALADAAHVAVTHDGETVPSPSDATFRIDPGEVVLLLGPSGCGKSTLTLCLNGLIPQAIPATVTGRIEVGDRDATETPTAVLSESVAMVFQDPDAQLVTGTVLDEVAFGPENLRLPEAEILARVETALRVVGLWHRRQDNPDTLSGGGRQRLAIACALAMGSPLLVLDEPTANLDPAGAEDVFRTLSEVASDGERSVLLVEHNLDAVIESVTRVVVLDEEGKTRYDGTPDAVVRGHALELHELGVWLPTVTLAALRLRRAGYAFAQLPLTPRELRHALAAQPSAQTAATPARVREHHTDTIVTARALSVSRGGTRILHDVDLEVARGEFVAIVGANGAGKSTLLHALAGVSPAARGMVTVDGIDPARTRARELTRHVGFVFQNPEHQFIASTVREELAVGLRRQKLPPAEVDARTDDLLARFGLTAKAQTHPFLLSGGQKRRLSVGTALAANAPVLALDEPTFGQDRARAEELLSLLTELNQSGTTILVVTHDLQLVAEHADRVIVLQDGEIRADGSPSEVLGDDAALREAGLRVPSLAVALAGLDAAHPLHGVARLRDLPGGTP